MAKKNIRGWCLEPKIIDKLRQALKDGKLMGSKSLVKLYDSEGKTKAVNHLKQFVNESTANLILEEMLKARNDGRKKVIQEWINGYLGENTKAKKTFTDKINNLREDLSKQLPFNELYEIENKRMNKIIQSVIFEKSGLNIEPETIQKINDLTDKLLDIKNNVDKTQFNNYDLKFFEIKKELAELLYSLNPAPAVEQYLKTWSRAAMLASVKSPIVNIISNAIKTGYDLTERELGILLQNFFTLGKADLVRGQTGLKKQYYDEVQKVYNKTGYDISRMIDIGSDIQNWYGENKNSNIIAKNAFLKGVKWFSDDLVFKILMGKPDVMTAALHFAHQLDIDATNQAHKEGLTGEKMIERARELFKSASGVEYQGKDKEVVKYLRSRAISAAQASTFTNKTFLSDSILKLRKLFPLGIGETLIPFAKIPANVINEGLEYGGVSALKFFKNVWDYKNAVKNNLNEQVKSDFMNNAIRNLIKSGIGMTAMYILVGLIDPDDFYDDYLPNEKQRQLMKEIGSKSNSIKINGVWWSLDYFGIFAPTLIGLLYAKKYGNSLSKKILYFNFGVYKSLQLLPGVKELGNYISGFKDFYKDIKDFDEKQKATAFGQSALDFVYTRTVPAILNDFAIAIDKKQRQIEKGNISQKFKGKIPFLRETLLPKLNIFGEELKSSGINNLFFGSRFSYDTSNEITKELSRLSKYSALPNLVELEKLNRSMKYIKETIGAEKFQNLTKYFGQNFKKDLIELIDSGYYKDLTSAEQKKEINDLKDKWVENTIENFKLWGLVEKSKEKK